MTPCEAIKSYKDLDVWKMAMSLAESCYRVTNAAEGYGRDQTGGFIQFLRIAQGSARGLETHLILAGRVGLLRSDVPSGLLDDRERISKMLRSMIRSLEARS